jgi:hypothetical protein
VEVGNTGSEEAHESCRAGTRNGLCKTKCSAVAGEGVVLILERAAVEHTKARGVNDQSLSSGGRRSARMEQTVNGRETEVAEVARQEAESSKVEVKVEVQFASRLALKSREEIWSQAAASLKPSVRAGSSDNLRHTRSRMVAARAAEEVWYWSWGGGAARDTRERCSTNS